MPDLYAELHEDWINPSAELGDRLTLLGVDSTTSAIMGYATDAMKRAGNSPAVINAFRVACLRGDYNHLIALSMAAIGEL